MLIPGLLLTVLVSAVPTAPFRPALVPSLLAQSTGDLIEALDHEDARERAAAARSLGALGTRARRALPRLVELLADSSHLVRSSASDALMSIGKPSYRPLTDALTDAELRGPALEVLTGMGERGQDIVLEDLTENGLFDGAFPALRKLGPAGAPWIGQALQEGDGFDLPALRILVRCDPGDAPTMQGALLDAIQDDDLRSAVVLVLESRQGYRSEQLHVVLELLGKERTFSREAACMWLFFFEEQAPEPGRIAIGISPYPTVVLRSLARARGDLRPLRPGSWSDFAMWTAPESLAGVGTAPPPSAFAPAVPLLYAFVETLEGSPEEDSYSIHAFRRLASLAPERLAQLREWLASDSPYRVQAALEGLQGLGGQGEAALDDVLAHRADHPRKVIQVLGAMESEQANAALRTFLSDADRKLQVEAALALGLAGWVPGEEDLPRLEEMFLAGDLLCAGLLRRHPSSVEFFVGCLDSEERDTRAIALVCLRELEARSTLAAVERVAEDDPDRFLRNYARAVVEEWK